LDDDEARYLIDQFNKYASWDVRSWEIMLSFAAVLIAANALLLSSMTEKSKTEMGIWVWGFSLALFVAVFVAAQRAIRGDSGKRNRYRTILVRLEHYRCRHKSVPNKALPDGITFKLIVEKPEEVETLLTENEPNPPGPPQT